MDTLCATLEKKMKFEEGERDMIMLQHKFEIDWADGTSVSAQCDANENDFVFFLYLVFFFLKNDLSKYIQKLINK